jgi:hypothetical protein
VAFALFLLLCTKYHSKVQFPPSSQKSSKSVFSSGLPRIETIIANNRKKASTFSFKLPSAIAARRGTATIQDY